LCSSRQLIARYKEIPDWGVNPQPQLDAEVFESSTRYDALNRPIQSVAPRSSLGRGKFNVTQPIFNEANLLERVDVWLERATAPAALLDPSNLAPSPVGVANIDYDAKGQRQRIDYKNGASTVYSYDPLTFRLNQLLTKRKAADFPDDDPQGPVAGWPGKQVQNLHYTYDPAGNITHIKDDAQQAIYFKNKYIEPSNDYVYDALYRLIQAEGREHLGQGGAPIPHSYNDARRVGILSANPPGRFAPNDRSAMGRYTERYVYDAVGNFLQMQHARSDAAVPGWTRRYGYGEASLIEPAKFSNRLSTTTVGTQPDEVYAHDAHGNMLGMPQLAEMQWDYKDQLRLTRRQRVDDDDLDGVEHEGERTFYVYDASGQRIRKVCEKALGLVEERIYLGGFEIFRKHNGPISAINLTLERETLHVMDDKQRIALVETRTLPTTPDPGDPLLLIRYQFGNHLGSANLELDEQAKIISYEEYSPYGSTTYQAVRSLTETGKRYRYTGKERDEESGLYYHGARYFSAWIGRWSAADPSGLEDGLNLFTYCRNSPATHLDPNGLWTWKGVWSEVKDAGKAGAGGVYGAGTVIVGAFVGGGKLTYYGSSKVFHEATGSSIWEEQAGTWDKGIEAVGRMVKAGPTEALKSYVKSSGDRFMAAADKGDMFEAGEAFGTTAMELALVADAAANGPTINVNPGRVTINVNPGRVPAGAAAVFGQTGGSVVMSMPNGGPLAMAASMMASGNEGGGDPGEAKDASQAKQTDQQTPPTRPTKAPKAPQGPKWENPKSRPTFGHTFELHSAKLKPNQLADRAKAKGHQVSQWTDDVAAAKLIADVAKQQGEGIHNVNIQAGMGRSFLGDATELTTDMARVVVKQDGTVRTAFPYNSSYPN
jgi:RHS repeat-associated protein